MVDNKIHEVVIVKPPIIVSYYKSGDPTANYGWVSKLTDINIIRTKKLTDEFINVCLTNKDKIFLHVEISGMGKTLFEPNIPSVKSTFDSLAKLINSGFPQKQILVVVSPILQNENGLKALKLLLRVFTEFKPLRLRFIRFSLLQYRQLENSKFVISNNNILNRQSTKGVMVYLTKSASFFKDYYNLINNYRSICTVDSGEEQLIGIRELMAFGHNNKNDDGTPIIRYENNSKYKPIVNLLSVSSPVRCHNRCLLCPFRY